MEGEPGRQAMLSASLSNKGVHHDAEGGEDGRDDPRRTRQEAEELWEKLMNIPFVPLNQGLLHSA